jgi:hypothetical protein
MTNDQHKAWAMQWKAAAPRLQAVRDQELRDLQSPSTRPNTGKPEQNGLVIFQRWMMRKALLDAACKSG